MNHGSYAKAQYLEADVMSRPPEWLIPLMYEHLLSRLRRASIQIETRDLEGKAISLAKANEIVLELAEALDLENGGEIASSLSALYAYFSLEIMNVGRTLDRAHLAKLIELIAELHEAWIGAAEQVAPRGRAAQASITAPAA